MIIETNLLKRVFHQSKFSLRLLKRTCTIGLVYFKKNPIILVSATSNCRSLIYCISLDKDLEGDSHRCHIDTN